MKGLNLSEWALEHRALMVYLMLLFVVVGAISYSALGREEDPSFSVKTMVVTVQWPGATIEDMLEQVTDRIEKKLRDTPSLDFLRSYTRPGQATIYVNLLEATKASLVPGLWQKVRNEVNDIRASLPTGVQGPFFNDEFGDVYGIIYAFTADGFTKRELRDHIEQIRTALLAIPDTAKAEMLGAQDEKIYLEFDVRRLAAFGLNREQVLQSLRNQNEVLPSGTIQTQSEKFAIRVSGAFSTEADLARVNLFANDRYIRLADIATVRHGYADPPEPLFRFNGEEAIGLALSMRSGGNNLEFGKIVHKRMKELTHDLPIGIEPHLVADQPVVVQHAIAGFTEALWEAIAIVLLVSFISLGFRAGLVVACTIPLVLAIVFAGMQVLDISLQRISLGALIIALGLLVDDAMITIEMMVSQLEQGVSKIRAASHAYVTTAFPMLTGTLVTISGFLPIGFARSGVGEYCFSLFAVVAMALIVSWFVAVLFAPIIGVTLLPATLKKKQEGDSGFAKRFRHVLLYAMRNKYTVIGGTIALLILALIGFRGVQQEFFPASDRPELLVNMTLPQSSSIYATQRAVDEFQTFLKGDADIDHYTVHIGEGAPRFILTIDQQLPSDNFAQAVVVTKSAEARDRLRARLEALMTERFPEMLVRISGLELGPPVGWPLQYRLSGDDPARVRELAFKAGEILASDSRTRLVNFDWNEPGKTIRVVINQDSLRRLGLSTKDLSDAFSGVWSGVSVTQIRSGIYLVDLVARAQADQRGSIEALRNLQVSLPNGGHVPLSQFATLEYTIEPPEIWRRDLLPTITVHADVAPGIKAETVDAALNHKLEAFTAALPSGYALQKGGTMESSAKGLASIAAAFPLTLVAMLTILMIQLQSFQRLFLALSVVPFGLIGIVAALLPTGTPMGFVAILGLIALSGMIIRNSVILLDQIESYVAAGKPRWDAVVEAALHRLRPIQLTAIAAILGMLPIAREVFWGPMAFTVIGGLAVATVLTLVFLPALYVAWFRVEEPKPVQSAQSGALPEPVEV